MPQPIRVLLAKVGLDGHDRGVKVVARTLRDAGMDVIYSGLHRTPEEVVDAAVQEDVDVLGVSLLSGVQLTVFPKIFELLRNKGADDIIVIAGGVMPDEDVVELKKMGVKEVLLQDTPPQTIVPTLTRLVDGTRRTLKGSLWKTWSFPAAYDAAYFPRAQSRYWFPRRETMPAGRARKGDTRAASDRLPLCVRSIAFYRRRWDEAGFHPDHLHSLDDFEDKVPVVTKNDLRHSQASAPPFGDYLCVPASEIYHIHGTSGTTGRPTAFAIGRNDWNAIANAHARIMWGMGIRPGDIICFCRDLQPLSGKLGRVGGCRTAGREGLSFRRRCAGHDNPMCAMAR